MRTNIYRTINLHSLLSTATVLVGAGLTQQMHRQTSTTTTIPFFIYILCESNFCPIESILTIPLSRAAPSKSTDEYPRGKL
ncbi:hypothetical protein BDR05DRAFT_567854 [Suillus weaverae]|nr:hypothetical protein BDR05DRAFT_567854 [Suillus weaverae]